MREPASRPAPPSRAARPARLPHREGTRPQSARRRRAGGPPQPLRSSLAVRARGLVYQRSPTPRGRTRQNPVLVTALPLSALAAATASTPRRRLLRELALTSGTTALVAALILWFGPPGSDMAAHVYQKVFFDQHGLVFWNNLWYAGRHSFITYSPLYYPLAAVVGIRVLAVLSLVVATCAYTLLVEREWGPRARWSSRVFAVSWGFFALTAAFPFALGAGLALVALAMLQRGRRWPFALAAALALAASTLAFALLVVVLGGIAL